MKKTIEEKRKEKTQYENQRMKETYSRVLAPKGTREIITLHNLLMKNNESVKDFIYRAVINQIKIDDEMANIKTDISKYTVYVRPNYAKYKGDNYYFVVTQNPNELESIYGTKTLADAKRHARESGRKYLVAVYNEKTGERIDVLKYVPKHDWVSVFDEYDV